MVLGTGHVTGGSAWGSQLSVLWLRCPCGSGSMALGRRGGVVWTHTYTNIPDPIPHTLQARTASAKQKQKQRSENQVGGAFVGTTSQAPGAG